MSQTEGLQVAIVRALEDAGATVLKLPQLGQGTPQLLAGYRGRSLLLRCKAPRALAMAWEERFDGEWQGGVETVHTVEEALSAIGALG